jgi:nicotinamide-nucleotide amidase
MNISDLARLMVDQKLTLSTVESCTGGAIAKVCTDLSGSSEWFVGGVVTYSNEMKIKLGVREQDIADHGAVSKEVVEQMAKRGLAFCDSHWSIAISGVAGPGGGSEEKPVGTVWMAWANADNLESEKCIFSGNRAEIREKSAGYIIDKLVDLLK